MNLRSKAFLSIFLIVFSLTVCCIILSYFFIDRQLASWVYEKNFARFIFLKRLSEISEYLNGFAAFSLIYFGIKRLWKKGKCKEQGIFIAALASLFSIAIADSLKPIFGRYWPETWIGNNPSWIQDKAYGFHFFHIGWSYASFPSGHTAIIMGVGTLIWLAFPKWRFLSCILVFLEVVGLLGMNYHFLSDIFGGAFIGWVVALFLRHYLFPNPEERARQL